MGGIEDAPEFRDRHPGGRRRQFNGHGIAQQIVAKTISLEALGLFGIPLVLIGYYRMLIITLTRVFSPRFSYLSGRKAEDEIRPLFVQGCRYMAMLAGAVAVLMWSTGPSFLLLWTRKPLIVSTVPALSIMVGGTFVFLSHRLGGDLLFGLGRQGQVARVGTHRGRGDRRPDDTAVVKFGIVGAGLGLAIPPIFVRGLLQTRFVCQALKLSLLEYYSKCIMRSWLVVAVMWALTKLVDWPSVINGWLSLAAASAMLLAGIRHPSFSLSSWTPVSGTGLLTAWDFYLVAES